MLNAARIGTSVAKGLLHQLRVQLYRSYKVPYDVMKSPKQVRFQLDKAWPQPSPISPKMPFAVLKLPRDEVQVFVRDVVSRFERTVKYAWKDAIVYLNKKPYLDCPDDATFLRYLTDSVYTYFLTEVLSQADLDYLQANQIDAAGVVKSDLSVLKLVKSSDGLYVSPSVVYYRKNGNTFDLIGIAMMHADESLGDLLRPQDGGVWSLAKMHVLQGAVYLSQFVTHPRCHFSIDAIIAVTKTLVPKEHPLFKLLEPHFYIQMALDYSVLHIKNGPGYNDPRLYYTAFSAEEGTLYKLFEVSFAGLEGHAAYAPFTFGYLLKGPQNEYTRFLAGYHEVVRRFAARFVAQLPFDTVVKEWLHHCQHYVKDFPLPASADDPDAVAAALTDALATIIWNCAIVHSVDHWQYHAVPMDHRISRLRVPAPFRREAYTFDVAKLTTTDDRLRQFMLNELYVKPHLLKRLQDVDYGFDAPALQEANRSFLGELRAYDANPPTKSYAPLSEICSSIQY